MFSGLLLQDRIGKSEVVGKSVKNDIGFLFYFGKKKRQPLKAEVLQFFVIAYHFS